MKKTGLKPYKFYEFTLFRLHSRILVSLVIVLLQTACVSIDKRVSTEQVDSKNTQGLDGHFSIHPSYYSNHHDDEEAPDGLSFFYQFFDRVTDPKEVDSIEIVLRKKELLRIKFLSGKNAIGGGTYTASEGLEIDNKGQIMLTKNRFVPAPIGVSFRKVLLYLNLEGDLVVEQTLTSGGIFLILPIAIHKKEMWIFPRMR